MVLSIGYDYVNLSPLRSAYVTSMIRDIFGRPSTCLGLNLTKISPPFISGLLCLLIVRAEGKPDFILVTVKQFPSFSYLTS